jgi:DNA-binding CsgD family transcriptional regulator
VFQLNQNDFEEILRIVKFCSNHIKTGNIDPKDLLIELLKVFRSYDAQFFPSNQNLNGADISKSFCIKEKQEDLEKYISYYWRYDPLYSTQFNTKPVIRVFKTDDVIPYSQLKKLDYYREYLRHINWFGELVIRLCNNDGFWGTMSLTRSPNQPCFNRNDVQKAQILLPYLINTFEATMFFSKINEELEAFEYWLESRPDGIILFDAKIHPIFYNNKARQICNQLSSKKNVSLRKYQNNDINIPRSIIEDCRRLIDSRNDGSCFSSNRIINTKNGGRYYFKYILVDQACKNIVLPYFIIHINDLSSSNEEIGVVIAKDNHLSKREEKISQYLGLGLTNKEIAEKLGISQLTVKSHIRNIFEKTGVKKRAQLAYLVK